jgi:xylulokinase
VIILAKVLSSILLDIGGSYIKSAIIESGKNNFENLRLYPTPEFIDDNSKKRVIPTEELLRVIDAAIEVQLQYKPEAKRIFTSGQMGGYVVKTEKGFEIVSWQDNRSLSPKYVDRYEEFEKWLRSSSSFIDTGSEIRPGLPLCSLAISGEDETELMQQPFRSVISFVTSYLTGFSSDDMHVTDAAASGMFDIAKNKWSLELVSKVSASLKFQNALSDVEKIGFSKKLGLNVYCGVGDQQASLFGAGLDSDNIVINIGTGGQVSGIHSGVDQINEYQVRPYFNGKKIRTITHLPSGRAFKAFVQFCVSENPSDADYQSFISMGASSPDYSLIDLSNYEETIEAISKSINSKNHSFAAASFFNSFIDSYVRSLVALNLSGKLIFAGGLGQKIELISKEISDRTNRDYSISSMQETTLAGLGKIANSL